MIRGNATVKAHIERAVEGIPAEAAIRGLVQAVIGLRVISFHILSYNTCQLTPILKMFSPKTYPTAASSPPPPPKSHSALQATPQHLPHNIFHTPSPTPSPLRTTTPPATLSSTPIPTPATASPHPRSPPRFSTLATPPNTSTPNKGTKR